MAGASILLAYHCTNTDNREKPSPLDFTWPLPLTWLVQNCSLLSLHLENQGYNVTIRYSVFHMVSDAEYHACSIMLTCSFVFKGVS